MSVVIHKDGVRELCTPEQLVYQLQAGWSLKKDEPKKELKSEKPEEIDVSEFDRYRALAKDLGIRIHPNSKLETIIKKIEASQSDKN